MKAGAVTADHEALKYFAGRWKVEAKMWAVPGAPPTESVNTNEGTMILGLQFLVGQGHQASAAAAEALRRKLLARYAPVVDSSGGTAK